MLPLEHMFREINFYDTIGPEIANIQLIFANFYHYYSARYLIDEISVPLLRNNLARFPINRKAWINYSH